MKGRLLTLFLLPSLLNAGVHFGSRNAAFETDAGSLSFTNTNVDLTEGTLRSVGVGSITNDASEYLNCTRMKVEKKGTTTSAMRVDGSLYLNDDTLTLTDNQRLSVHGGQVTQAITVTADELSPAVLQGQGSVTGGVDVNNSAGLVLRWYNSFGSNIELKGGSLTLENNLMCAHGKRPYATASESTLFFNGYKMFTGGSPSAPVSFGSAALSWQDTDLVLNGDILIESALTLINKSSINGQGHQIKVTGSIAPGSDDSIVRNLHFIDFAGSFFTANNDWFFTNVIIDDGTNKLLIHDAKIATGDFDFFGDSGVTFQNAARIELLGSITVGGTWVLAGNGVQVNGNGNALEFDSFGDGGGIHILQDCYWQDIELKQIATGAFRNSNNKDWYMRNVRWFGLYGGQGFHVNPSPYAVGEQYAQVQFPALFSGNLSGNITWKNGVHIKLLNDTGLSGTWNLSSTAASVIEGDGRTFRLGFGTIDFNADLYFSNIILSDIEEDSFDRAPGKYLYLSNVTWHDGPTDTTFHVHATTNSSGTIAPAQLSLATTSDGNLFGTAISWDNGVNMELKTKMTCGSVWTFSEDSVVDGNGHVVDLNDISGAFTIAENKKLTLRNMVITGWGVGSIAFANNNATLALSNVTIILDNDVTLGANERLSIDGPLTVMTGSSYTFDATAGTTNHTSFGGTVWFDTGGGNHEVDPTVLFDSAANIAVRMMPRTLTSFTYGDDGVNIPTLHVEDSLWLEYRIDYGSDGIPEALGRQVTLANANAVTIRGNGRTFYFGNTPASSLSTPIAAKMMTVSGSASNLVELHDLILDGWNDNHISDTNGLIRYCQGTTLRLQSDVVLTTGITIGTDTANEIVVLDLNGHDLDLSSDNAAINLANNSVTLVICNGRLINLKDGSGGEKKLAPASATPTIILQDVELVLSEDTTIEDGNFTFKGRCAIRGTGDYTLQCNYTPLTIAAGAELRIECGMTLALHGNGVDPDASLTFASKTSTLHLERCMLDVSNLDASPTWLVGSLVLDGIVDVTGDMTLGSTAPGQDLNVYLRPNASMRIGAGRVTYASP